jgi:hypothetical protein
MRPLALLTALALMTACTVPPPEKPVPGGPVEQHLRKAPPRTAPGASDELRRYYARIEDSLSSRGLLRTDGGGTDAPYTSDDLVRNFIQIALFEEYSTVGNRIVPAETPSQLHKWTEPVRLEIIIGAGVDAERADRDRQLVAEYAARLGRVAGHPIDVVGANGNFHVLVLTDSERRAFGPRLQRLIPGIGPAAVRAVTEMPRENYCLVFALDRGGRGVYTQAVAVVRDEHPDLLRRSCFQEEIAQGLGLSNDSPRARPSIFNDDEEFALLTTHDEYLLRMLYDPRMQPGMTMQEALPVARTIAQEILPAS